LRGDVVAVPVVGVFFEEHVAFELPVFEAEGAVGDKAGVAVALGVGFDPVGVVDDEGEFGDGGVVDDAHHFDGAVDGQEGGPGGEFEEEGGGADEGDAEVVVIEGFDADVGEAGVHGGKVVLAEGVGDGGVVGLGVVESGQVEGLEEGSVFRFEGALAVEVAEEGEGADGVVAEVGVLLGADDVVGEECGVVFGGAGLDGAAPGEDEVVCGDGVAVGPAGVGSEGEGVDGGVGADVWGEVGDAGDGLDGLGVVGGEALPEAQGHLVVVVPGHAGGVECFDGAADGVGEVGMGQEALLEGEGGDGDEGDADEEGGKQSDHACSRFLVASRGTGRPLACLTHWSVLR